MRMRGKNQLDKDQMQEVVARHEGAQNDMQSVIPCRRTSHRYLASQVQQVLQIAYVIVLEADVAVASTNVQSSRYKRYVTCTASCIAP